MSSFAISDKIYYMESIEIKKVFTTNLKKYRLLNNMTQTELAIAADLSVGFLCDLESGKKWGTLETMAKLATALHIKPYQLLMPDENKNSEVNIHEDLHQLSHNLKQTIDNQVKTILAKYTD